MVIIENKSGYPLSAVTLCAAFLTPVSRSGETYTVKGSSPEQVCDVLQEKKIAVKGEVEKDGEDYVLVI